MKNHSAPKAFCLTLLLAVFTGCSEQAPTALDATPERIISLAPDITEMVYALDLGDKLVGATTYCLYPEAAQNVPRVGGFGQFNFEAIVALRPDVIILHHQYESEKSRLEGLGIPYIETGTRSTSEIMESIQSVGAACGAEAKATALLDEMHAQINACSTDPANRPRVLITFGGDAGSLDQIHAFGADCLHHELLQLAGGQNVVENHLAFSVLSKEAVIRLDPEIIIQLAPGTDAPDDPLKAWESLAGITAVKNRQVYVFTDDYTCIPGPRFIRILNDFSRIIRQND